MTSFKRFTLIEMIMVMVVIMILIGLLLPGMVRSRELAFSAECVSNQRQLVAALSRHSLNADGMLPEPGSWLSYVAELGHDMEKVLICPKSEGGFNNVEVEKLPTDLSYHAVEDSDNMGAYLERGNYVLPAAQAVNIMAPGTYTDSFTSTAGSIPAAREVDVYLFHYDPLPPIGILNNAEFTFAGKILGVIVTTGALNGSDATLGSPSTTYPRHSARGFETKQDILTLSSDMQTIGFDYLWTSSAVEHARVLVEAGAGVASYGMNNLTDTKHWPRGGQLLLVDYNKAVVDIDGDASDDVLGEEIAWRHLGKANGAFADGSVQSALTFSDLADAKAELWQQ